MDHELLTTKEVADLFRVSTMTIYRMVEHDEIPVVRIGTGTFRYRRTDIDEILAGATQGVSVSRS